MRLTIGLCEEGSRAPVACVLREVPVEAADPAQKPSLRKLSRLGKLMCVDMTASCQRNLQPSSRPHRFPQRPEPLISLDDKEQPVCGVPVHVPSKALLTTRAKGPTPRGEVEGRRTETSQTANSRTKLG